MLRVKTMRLSDGTWDACVTLSGRGVRMEAQRIVNGKTRERALKKLHTLLKNEFKISHAASYRIAVCEDLVAQEIAKEKLGRKP